MRDVELGHIVQGRPITIARHLQQMLEANKNEHANALKEVKPLYEDSGLSAGMLKGVLAAGRGKR